MQDGINETGVRGLEKMHSDSDLMFKIIHSESRDGEKFSSDNEKVGGRQSGKGVCYTEVWPLRPHQEDLLIGLGNKMCWRQTTRHKSEGPLPHTNTHILTKKMHTRWTSACLLHSHRQFSNLNTSPQILWLISVMLRSLGALFGYQTVILKGN